MSQPIGPTDENDSPPPSSGGYQSLKDGDLANPLSLGEFFHGLGGLMRLPPKARMKLSAQKRGSHPSRILLPAAAIALAVIFVALQRGQADAPDEVPPGLIGRWVTTASSYSDRVLEFRPNLVIFHTGPETEDRTEHRITRVQTRLIGDTAVVTLAYLEAGTSYELSFRYTSVPEPVLSFTNQDRLIWRPAGASPIR